jgi:prevent-host-death family protein
MKGVACRRLSADDKKAAEEPLPFVVTWRYNVATLQGGPMAAVGIRELKSDLSKYLKRVGLGERITVTDRGRPIAVLAPIEEPSTAVVQAMIADGTAHWTDS